MGSLLTVEEARSLLRVGRNVMYALIKQGLPHVKVGRQIRIPVHELETSIKNKTIAS